MPDTDQKKELSHQFALSFDLGDGRAMQINGVFAKDDSYERMNEQVDTLWAVMERLRARVWLAKLRTELATAEIVKQQAVDSYQAAWREAEKFTKIGKNVPDRLKVDAESHLASMKVHENKIESIKVEIAEFIRRAA